MAYDLGDPVPLSINIKDSSGTLANATLVTLYVTGPDGSTTSAAITPTSTGVYQQTYAPSTAGRYIVRWAATGTNASAYTDTFDVNDSADLTLVSLADVKTYLNITSTSADEELRQFILEATDIAERLTSRQLRRKTYTEAYSVSGPNFSLKQQPVVSVTSVTEDGVTLTAGTDYVLDQALGLLYRGSTLSPLYWHSGSDNITVVYVSGEVNPSPTAQLLVKEITRHLWRTQRGASPMNMGNGDDFIPGGNNIVTYRIKELAELISIPTVA
jgi:hypothetical protein